MPLAQQHTGVCGLARLVTTPPNFAITLAVLTHQINANIAVSLSHLFQLLQLRIVPLTTVKIALALKDVHGLVFLATTLRFLAQIMGAQTLRLNVAAALAMSNAVPVEDATKELVLLALEIEVAIITRIAEAVCPMLTVCGIPIRSPIASLKSSVISHIVAWL